MLYFEKINGFEFDLSFSYFKQYLNEHKNIFQNVDKTKFYITSV